MAPIRTNENRHLSKYKTNKAIRAKVDDILHRCSQIFSNLGTETSLDLKTVERAKKTEDKWLKEIKEIDPQFYKGIKRVE